MRSALGLLGALALGLPVIALADLDEYIHTPNIEYGEREIDMKYGTEKEKDENGGGRTSAGSIGFGYGATQWWFTEAYVKYHKEPGDKTQYDAFEWENKLLVTEPNRYFVDVSLFTEFEVPRDRDEGYELRFGPLFQWDTGPLRWNANLLFGRVFHSKEEGPRVTELGYQFQVKYPLIHDVEVGVQAFGEMGKWNHWEPREEQSHKIGPAVLGKVKLEGRQAIRYNAAWLIGSNAAPRNTFRVQAEYEF